MNKVIGLDLGTKTLGISISDVLGIPHGYENFTFQENAYRQAIAHVKEVTEKENITEIALGYPLNMDGSEGDSAKRSVRFKEELLEMNPSLKVTLVDERMTTLMANRLMLQADLSRNKRKQIVDMQSAIVILESYLARKEHL